MPTLTVTAATRSASVAAIGRYGPDELAAAMKTANFNQGATPKPYLQAHQGSDNLAVSQGAKSAFATLAVSGGAHARTGVDLSKTDGSGLAVSITVQANGDWTFTY